jgi:hypothetical protein
MCSSIVEMYRDVLLAGYCPHMWLYVVIFLRHSVVVTGNVKLCTVRKTIVSLDRGRRLFGSTLTNAL